ncbi:MAG: MOSC N-terminal beta barrel domain-containing protein [Bryobacteraceae bacterium]
MVKDIRIYPIKALDAVRVDQARVLASGAFELDRRWALVDARGKFVNAKNRAEIHSIRAVYDLLRLEVALDGRVFSLVRDGKGIARSFSDRFGEPIEWRENLDVGFPDDTDSPGPTFLSTASLTRVGEWFGLSLDEARRRFRANVDFDGVEPFWEDRLYGTLFRAGAVEIDAINPCQRCAVPSRDALTGAPTDGFQKRFAELRRTELPAFAKTALFTHFYRLSVNTRIAASQAGKTIRVGDEITCA